MAVTRWSDSRARRSRRGARQSARGGDDSERGSVCDRKGDVAQAGNELQGSGLIEHEASESSIVDSGYYCRRWAYRRVECTGMEQGEAGGVECA